MEITNTGRKPIPPPASCAVCGETSHQVAVHYGRLMCNGCRAFFKRTVQGKMKVSDCKLRGECTVNPASRKDCKPCRYQACLRAGVDINKVQPARESSAESTSRERRVKEEEDPSKRQSRLERAPPRFPEPFHPHYNHHQNIYHPMLTTTLPPAAAPKLYQAPFLRPIVPSQLPPPPPQLPPPPSQLPPPPQLPPTYITPLPSTNFGFNTFNIHHNNNHNNSNDTNHTGYSDYYHRNAFSADASNTFPFVGGSQASAPNIINPYPVPAATDLSKFMSPQLPNTSVGLTTQNVLSSTDVKPYSPYDLSQRPNVNFMYQPHSFTSSTHWDNTISIPPSTSVPPSSSSTSVPPSSSSTSVPPSSSSTSVPTSSSSTSVPTSSSLSSSSVDVSGSKFSNEMLASTTYTAFYSAVNEKQSSQKSSAFMIDTLLDKNITNNTMNDNTSTVSKPTPAMPPHHNTTTQSIVDAPQTSMEEVNQNKDDDYGNSTPEIESDVDVLMRSYQSSDTQLSENNTDGKNEDLVHHNASQISNIMSPIVAEDEEDNDDNIFIHPIVESTTGEKHTHITTTDATDDLFKLQRERLTSTPNQKKHPSCDSPEAELLNVVDIINTPSPINPNPENSTQDEGFESQHDHVTDGGSLQNDNPQPTSDSGLEVMDKIPEHDTKAENNTDNNSDFNVNSSNSGANFEECHVDKEDKNVSDIGSSSSHVDGDEDSGMASSRGHCSNHEISSTSNHCTIPSASSFKIDKSNIEELSALDQIQSSQINSDTENNSKCNLCGENNTTNSNTNTDYGSSNLNNFYQTISNRLSSSKGHCSKSSTKGSAPRKWKRVSSNENLPLVDNGKSPKRAKCSFSATGTQYKRNKIETTSSTLLTQEIKDNENCTEEKLHSISCRERLSEIKFLGNSANSINECFRVTEKTIEPNTEISNCETHFFSSNNNIQSTTESVKGNNCVNLNSSQEESTSDLPVKNSKLSSFLDSIIQQIRNAESGIEVENAKKELERFYHGRFK